MRDKKSQLKIKYNKDDINIIKQLLGKGDCLLIDVRTKNSFDCVHIDKTINIPLDNLKIKIKDIAPQKNISVYLFCANGYRSAIGCNILESMGYENVTDLGAIHSYKYGFVSIASVCLHYVADQRPMP